MRVFSLEELPDVAREFWQLAGDEKIFAFHGEMGTGKTTTIAALCHAKGVGEAVSSPTFSIINEYSTLPEGNLIYHMDLYRLKDEEEVVQAGVEDCLYSGALCFIEWPSKAGSILPSDRIDVYLQLVDEGKRSMEVVPRKDSR